MARYEEFEINQGTDLRMKIHLVNQDDGSIKNLLNHTLQSQMKRSFDDSAGEAITFDTAITNPEEGIGVLSLSNATTRTLKTGRYHWDVNLSYTDSSNENVIERVLQGVVTIVPGVTGI